MNIFLLKFLLIVYRPGGLALGQGLMSRTFSTFRDMNPTFRISHP